MRGRVVSNKAMRTVTVLVEHHTTHPMYGKSFLRTNKFLVDDQLGVKVGDIVDFIKVAPISKRKHWKVTQVVGRDIVAIETEIIKEAAQEAIEEVLPAEVDPKTETVEATTEVEVQEKPKKTASKKKVVSKKETAKADK